MHGKRGNEVARKRQHRKEQRLAMFESRSHARSQVQEVADSLRATFNTYSWRDYVIDNVEVEDEFVVVDVTWHNFWNR